MNVLLVVFAQFVFFSSNPLFKKNDDSKYLKYIIKVLKKSDLQSGLKKPTSHKLVNKFKKMVLIPHLRLKKSIKNIDSLIDLPIYLEEIYGKKVRFSIFYDSEEPDTLVLHCSSGYFDVLFIPNLYDIDQKLTDNCQFWRYNDTSCESLHKSYSYKTSNNPDILRLDKPLDSEMKELVNLIFSINASFYFTVENFLFSIWYYKNGQFGVIYLEAHNWKVTTLKAFLEDKCSIVRLRTLYD